MSKSQKISFSLAVLKAEETRPVVFTYKMKSADFWPIFLIGYSQCPLLLHPWHTLVGSNFPSTPGTYLTVCLRAHGWPLETDPLLPQSSPLVELLCQVKYQNVLKHTFDQQVQRLQKSSTFFYWFKPQGEQAIHFWTAPTQLNHTYLHNCLLQKQTSGV